MNVNKIFVGSRMNKSVDERLLGKGEYIDAQNIRISSDENGEAGVVANAKGTSLVSSFGFENSKCIGAFSDEERETIYWFVTSSTDDYIVSYNVNTNTKKVHVKSNSVLNFDENYLINDINMIDDLLFFTDNLNPPRRINIKENYPDPIGGVDQITEDDISVIVKPPYKSPEIRLIKTANDDNYLEDKFIRFAYRYKYKNGEYSALSQFSDVAFNPKQFSVNYANYNMEGMQNDYNAAAVTLNSGPKNVVGIDLCFKLSNSNIINVIDKYDKENEGWTDNDDVSIVFNNQKIYTTLPESELLRLYDNVPRKARTQEIIGNRIMYGNYLDGYNIETKPNYTTKVISEDLGYTTVDSSRASGSSYSIGGSLSVDNSQYIIDLDGVEMIEGGSIFIDFNISHSEFGGDSSYSDAPENSLSFGVNYIFPEKFSTPQELAQDQGFIDTINSVLPIEDAADGYSLADSLYNNVVPKTGWELVGGGVTTLDNNFVISYTSTSISIQLPALKFEETANPGTYAYEYLTNSSTDVSVLKIDQINSLHSNRDYELGIVYLDEYNRATTALTSINNAVHVNSDRSTFKNSIEATIKSTAPDWANRYRFVLKSSKGAYDTIYSNVFFFDPSQSAWWCKLEGDNQTKVKKGDTVIVKRSKNGPASKVIKTKILDIGAKEADFIDPETTTPTGVYMKIKPRGYSLSDEDAPVIDNTSDRYNVDGHLHFTSEPNPDYTEGGTEPEYREYSIPAGSEVQFDILIYQFGPYYNRYEFKKTFLSSNDYDNMHDFILGENVDFNKPTNDVDADSADTNEISGSFITDIGDWNEINEGVTAPISTTVTYRNLTDIEYVRPEFKVKFYRDSSTGVSYLGFRNPNRMIGSRNAYMVINMTVIRSGTLLVLETEPIDSDNEIYYEGHDSFPIVNGFHGGNVQDQTASQDAIVNVNMYNCFAFGNGVESFKINDELSTPGLTIGARVTAVSEEDYKETRRYADITYSGVYNEDTNVNKLNEFNLGLSNFSVLERSFGPIEKMHARTSDILVLQEDKISTVLANGKNLFSDASAGGAIISTPDVLGQQIPRFEEYGISNNPESFASFGYDVFFTDTKRGSVINLRGDELNIISNNGLGSWFRDEFINSNNNIKLGAFDNYTKEYVLSITDTAGQEQSSDVSCGISISQDNANGTNNYTFQLGSVIGTYDVDYTISSGSITVVATYNGVEVKNETFTTSGTFSLDKDAYGVDEVDISITSVNATYSFVVGCVEAQSLTIISITKNNPIIEGKEIHHEFTWSDNGHQGTTQSSLIQIGEGPVSSYTTISGLESFGPIPTEGSTVTMRSVKELGDTLNFDSDGFKYLVSDTLYESEDINTLYPLLQDSGTVVNPSVGLYESSFIYSNNSNHQYLYLVWDYVQIADTDIPVITLLGDNPYDQLSLGQPYNEFGATATDATEGDLTDDIVIDASDVDTDTEGTYYVTYNVSDSSGNAAIEVVRTVEVGPSYCTAYTVGTTSETGQPFSYTACDGTAASGSIGGAGGYDSESFCAVTDSVTVSAEITLVNDGPCS